VEKGEVQKVDQVGRMTQRKKIKRSQQKQTQRGGRGGKRRFKVFILPRQGGDLKAGGHFKNLASTRKGGKMGN